MLDIASNSNIRHGQTSSDRVRSALSHLNPCARETWVRAGTCLKSEFGEDGFELWDTWGAQASNHKTPAARAVWKSIRSSGRLTIASLFYDAKQAGWQDTTVYKKPTKAEIDARKAASAARAAAAEAEEAQRQEAAALRAQAIWDASVPAPQTHPYLVKKGVQPHGLRVGKWEVVDGGTGEWITVTTNGLMLPVLDVRRNLRSLQCIFPDGRKSYLVDGAKKGNFLPIGTKPLQRNGKNVFVLVEGYATGASVHECTGHMVLVCFDTSGLARVSELLRAKQPDAVITFAADNDTETTGNPGVSTAIKAALAVGGLVAVPPPGDFNDLHLQEGTHALTTLIEEVLSSPALRMATQKYGAIV